MSTIGPEAVRGIEGRLAGRGVRLLDAPVSGGVARAERGDLLIMAGGPADLFEEVKPLLAAMGSTVAHCGGSVGDGQSVKLVNQLLCGVHIAAAGEALAYAEALGLDPRSVFETIRHGAANSFMLEDRGERMLGREFVPAKSALDIFVKDMGLVREAAGEQGFRTPLADVRTDYTRWDPRSGWARRTIPVSCASSRTRTERAEPAFLFRSSSFTRCTFYPFPVRVVLARSVGRWIFARVAARPTPLAAPTG